MVSPHNPPTVEDIQDVVESTLIEGWMRLKSIHVSLKLGQRFLTISIARLSNFSIKIAICKRALCMASEILF